MNTPINDNEVKALISLLDAFDAVLQQRIEAIVHRIQFENLLEDLKLWIHTNDDNLLNGALLIARYQYPDMDTSRIFEQLQQIKKEIWLELNENLTALEIINIINHILFTNHNFSGNTANYHAPQNSFINIVLESKKGNPLTLGIVYLTIAEMLDLPIYGVNLPEHFVLAYCGNDEHFQLDKKNVLCYINPFSKGTVFGKSDIDVFVNRLKLTPQDSHYYPCSNRDMILRMVRNLSHSYQKLGDTDKVEELAQMIALFNVK